MCECVSGALDWHQQKTLTADVFKAITQLDTVNNVLRCPLPMVKHPPSCPPLVPPVCRPLCASPNAVCVSLVCCHTLCPPPALECCVSTAADELTPLSDSQAQHRPLMTYDLTSSTSLTPQLDGPGGRQAGREARRGRGATCGCHRHVSPLSIQSSLPSSVVASPLVILCCNHSTIPICVLPKLT